MLAMSRKLVSEEKMAKVAVVAMEEMPSKQDQGSIHSQALPFSLGKTLWKPFSENT